MALEAGELVTELLDEPFLLLEITEEIGHQLLEKGGVTGKIAQINCHGEVL